jgi:hypothetical protein
MVVLCIGGGIYGMSLGKHVTQSGFYDEGSESVKASLIADGAYGRDTSGHIVAIYTAPEGKTVDDPEFTKKILDRRSGTTPTRSCGPSVTSGAPSYWRTWPTLTRSTPSCRSNSRATTTTPS